jgi:hypothetical protein
MTEPDQLKIELRAGQSAAEAGALDTDLPKPPAMIIYARRFDRVS